MTKTCTKCRSEKSFDYFSRGNGKNGLKSRCKECIRKDYQERKPDPETHYLQNRKSWLKTRYNLTVDEYNRMLINQEGCCAICGSFDSGKPRNFCVDHDHKCCLGRISCGECVRGLICDSCNIILGRSKDDPEILRKAAMYLEGFENNG